MNTEQEPMEDHRKGKPLEALAHRVGREIGFPLIELRRRVLVRETGDPEELATQLLDLEVVQVYQRDLGGRLDEDVRGLEVC